MTSDEAADLSARTLAAIDKQAGRWRDEWLAADRERVASDVRGITDTYAVVRHNMGDEWSPDWDVMSMGEYLAVARIKECADGLRRTARLYGVTP